MVIFNFTKIVPLFVFNFQVHWPIVHRDDDSFAALALSSLKMRRNFHRIWISLRFKLFTLVMNSVSTNLTMFGEFFLSQFGSFILYNQIFANRYRFHYVCSRYWGFFPVLSEQRPIQLLCLHIQKSKCSTKY